MSQQKTLIFEIHVETEEKDKLPFLDSLITREEN